MICVLILGMLFDPNKFVYVMACVLSMDLFSSVNTISNYVEMNSILTDYLRESRRSRLDQDLTPNDSASNQDPICN